MIEFWPFSATKISATPLVPGIRLDSADITASFHQIVPHLAAEFVIANPPEHGYGPAQSRSGVSLIRSFTSGLREIGGANNGFADDRNARRDRHQIHI